MTYGCIRFVDSYRFLSNSVNSLVKILIDNTNRALKNLKEELVDIDEILKFVKKIVEDEKTIKDLEKRLSR